MDNRNLPSSMLTKREYAAIQMMNSLRSNPEWVEISHYDISVSAVELADAIFDQLEKEAK